MLIWDRSPASELTETDRRALARISNAVFHAAERGEVHLVQRRNGPFDFSYLAIKAGAAVRPAVGQPSGATTLAMSTAA
jgi:hypothetical protein